MSIFLLVCLTTQFTLWHAASCIPIAVIPAKPFVNLPIQINPSGPNYFDSNTAFSDVKATIEQVQKRLESDPSLPRLTRGEIEDLFEEVTKEEYEKSVKAGDISRAKHMRALMLVLPYNANSNSTSNLEELYNLPPITKVISNEPKTKNEQKILVPSGKVEVVSVGSQNPTTYKPAFRLKPLKTYPDPTTYHPITTTTQKPVATTRTTSFVEKSTQKLDSSKNRFSSHYKSDNFNYTPDIKTNFEPKPTTSKPKISPELEEILLSLGFSAQSQSRTLSKISKKDKPRTMMSSIVKHDPNDFNDFQPIPTAFSAGDFRKSLIPQFRTNDYNTFKPIPIPNDKPSNIEPELESYLREFGIITPLQRRPQKALRYVISDRIDMNIDDDAKNIFKPSKVDTDEEDYKKLQQLLQTLRELQKVNTSLSEEALEKLNLRNFNLSDALLAQGPNPIFDSETDIRKNEVKRQTESPEPIRYRLELNPDNLSEGNNNVSPPEKNANNVLIDEVFTKDEDNAVTNSPLTDDDQMTSTPTTTSSTLITTTTTEEPRNNFADLGDSFPGGLDPITEEPLPPPRRNGFYFLADWNSFLEVGEEPNQVVVRFDPKVGDPSRFLPVNVP